MTTPTPHPTTRTFQTLIHLGSLLKIKVQNEGYFGGC